MIARDVGVPRKSVVLCNLSCTFALFRHVKELVCTSAWRANLYCCADSEYAEGHEIVSVGEHDVRVSWLIRDGKAVRGVRVRRTAQLFLA